MAQPTIVEDGDRRLVIEIHPSVEEIRGRIGRLSALTFLLFVVLAGLGWGVQLSMGGEGLALPLAAAGVLSALFLLVRMRRMTIREALVLDRDAGTIEFRSRLVPRHRLPAPIALSSAKGVRVVEGSPDFRRDLVVDRHGEASVTCFSLQGRRIADEERSRVDARLREVAARMSAFVEGG